MLSIQGKGPANAVDGFKNALKIEANAAGYDVTDNIGIAKYDINFTVEYDLAGKVYRFNVSLVKVEDSSVIVTMEYYFTDEEEMLLYSQLIFFMLMANLPDGGITTGAAVEDDSWRNKWLYARASFDYLVSFFNLKGDGLIGGIGIYYGTFENPTRTAPLDNKVISLPGLSLGAEVQFLDWMSAEPGVQLSIEELLRDKYMFNMLLSMEIKFPLKYFRNLVLEPYGAFACSLRFPKGNDAFEQFPLFAFGGGVQAAIKAGKNGAAFIDVNFLYFGEASMKNRYDELCPNPDFVKYDHFVVGFSVGYKYGFYNR